MKTRVFRGASICLAAFVLFAGTAVPQTADPPSSEPTAQPTVEELQRQLEEMARQLQLVQEQLEELKKQQELQKKEAEVERLRQAAAAEVAKRGDPGDVDSGTEFVSGTRMQTELNPEISVNGDVFLVGGDNLRTEMQPRHFELDFQSYLDPYTRMKVVFGYEGAHSVWGYHDHDHDEDGEEHKHVGFVLDEF